MSCVIALVTQENKVILAAERQTSDHIIKVKSAIPKVFTKKIANSIHTVGMGCVGGLKLNNFARHIFIPPVLDEETLKCDRHVSELEGDGYLPRMDVFNEVIDDYIIGQFMAALSEQYMDYVRKTTPNLEQIEDSMLVAYMGRIYHVDSTFAIHITDHDFEVIGSAREIAYGSLLACKRCGITEPDKRLEIAFDVTSTVSLYSDGDWNMLTV